MIRFLRITGGIELTEVFNRVITRRLGTSGGLAETLVQRLMRDICLRRRKDMKFVDLKLPEKKEFVHRITFRADEKRKYDTLLYVRFHFTLHASLVLTPLAQV
jgi:SWI/SNF-related matrix-associated actin-dependent regulator of chromatin subfamily A3